MSSIESSTSQNASAAQADDEWRAWIVHSLLSGYSRESIAATMRKGSFSDDVIEAEIQKAVDSPYYRGTSTFAMRARKYEWTLANASRKRAMSKGRFAIERRHRLGADEFFEEYYFRDRPVIITGMLDDWDIMQRWSLDTIKSRIGDKMINIQYGREGAADYEVNHLRHVKEMTVGEYLDMVKKCSPTNDFYFTSRNSRSPGVREIMELLRQEAGSLPYLNDMMAGSVWIGPAGTITPLHQDPVDNMMVQIIGRKRIFAAPAADIVHLYPDRFYYSPFNPAAPDYSTYPNAANASFAECILHPGEILFLPVGAWNRVESLAIALTLTYRGFPCGNFFEDIPVGSP